MAMWHNEAAMTAGRLNERAKEILTDRALREDFGKLLSYDATASYIGQLHWTVAYLLERVEALEKRK